MTIFDGGRGRDVEGIGDARTAGERGPPMSRKQSPPMTEPELPLVEKTPEWLS